MKLYLVDDNEHFRETLKSFLEEFLSCNVIGEASDGKEFLDTYDGKADLILMDINMPGIDGLKATKLGTWNDRDIKIIAVSQYTSIADLQQLIEAGFKGFVSKTKIFDELKTAIETVQNGRFFFPNELEVKKSMNQRI